MHRWPYAFARLRLLFYAADPGVSARSGFPTRMPRFCCKNLRNERVHCALRGAAVAPAREGNRDGGTKQFAGAREQRSITIRGLRFIWGRNVASDAAQLFLGRWTQTRNKLLLRSRKRGARGVATPRGCNNKSRTRTRAAARCSRRAAAYHSTPQHARRAAHNSLPTGPQGMLDSPRAGLHPSAIQRTQFNFAPK